jgi:four helix bundle protein
MEPKPFDLCARTFKFANDVLDWVERCPRNFMTMELLRQLIKAGTSVGANTEEASEAQSSKDGASKTGIALKEVRESRYWLRLLKIRVGPENNPDHLIQEAQELRNIFKSRIRKLQSLHR